MLLEAEGYSVVGEAEDGLSALRAVEELRPDVVLLDVQLPDIDGIEVAARLTANGSAPAIVLTSSRDLADLGSACETVAMCAASFQRLSSPAPRWRHSSDIAQAGPLGPGRRGLRVRRDRRRALILTSDHAEPARGAVACSGS